LAFPPNNQSTDGSQFFNEAGHFVVYSQDIEENLGIEQQDLSVFDAETSDGTDQSAAAARGTIDGSSGFSSDSSISVQATPQATASTNEPGPANMRPRSATPQPRAVSLPSSSQNQQGRNIPAAAASLPYLGPTGRSRKRKNDDEATAFLKETLSTLTKSLSQPSSQDTDSSRLENLDPDSCIARNVESSLKSLPNSLKLMYRRKFRELLQECEEAAFNFQAEQSNSGT